MVLFIIFIDNIIFTFQKKKSNKIKQIVNLLFKTLTIKVIEELKFFLGLYIICHW